MTEADIAYENGRHWVFKDKRRNLYVVFTAGITHSESDSAYALDEDGLSIAKARCDYLARRKEK
jgi:hypothetical protein